MSFALGARSLERLEGVHPSVVLVVHRAITYTPIDFGVHEGVRTRARQKLYVERGVSWTMDGKHLIQADGYGHAVDLVPYLDGELRWEWPAIYPIAAAVRRAAIELKVQLRWGGTWSILNSLPAEASGLEYAVEAYVAQRKAQGKRARIDGPHYELVDP